MCPCSKTGGRIPKGPVTQSDLQFRNILRTFEHALGKAKLGIRRCVREWQERDGFQQV